MKLNRESFEYYTFVLGYDLLHDEIRQQKLACDEAYEKCKEIIRLFDQSEEIDDLSLSCYEALEKFLNNNNELIEQIIKN